MNTVPSRKENIIFLGGALLCLLCIVASLIFQLSYLSLLPFLVVAAAFMLLDIRSAFFLLIASIPISYNLKEQLGIGIDFPDEPLMLFLTAAFGFVLLLNRNQLPWKRWIQNPLLMLVALTFLWTSITVICSDTPLFSAKYLLKRLWYLLPFLGFGLLLFREPKVMIRAFQFMFVPLFALVLLVLYRFSAFQFRFEDVHDPVQPFFLNHVMYGSMISCFVPLIAGALFLVPRFSFRWFSLLVALAIFLMAVYFSYSRAAWMAVLFALTAGFCIRFRVMHWLMTGIYVLVIAGVLWLAHENQYLNYRPKFERTIMHTSLADHIMATLQGTDISSAERYYRWIAAVRMSTERPITGVGPNNFYDYYKAYTISSYKTWVSRNLERSTTHNYFLFMLVEQGYPALLLYALMIWMIFWYGQALWHKLEDRFLRRVLLSVLCMIAALFINNFFSELLETDKIGSLFLLGIAVIVCIDGIHKSRQKTLLSETQRPVSADS